MPVTATPAALEALARLRAAHGPLVLFQSGGCCDGSAPICIEAGELPVAPSDVLLGAVGDIPFYIDGEQFERWGRPRLEIDAREGAAEGFSLEGSIGVHFVSG